MRKPSIGSSLLNEIGFICSARLSYICNMVSQVELQALIGRTTKQISSENAQCGFPTPGSDAFADTIDHTLLKLDATEAQIDKLCEEAKLYKFRVVCVRLPWVER